PDGKRAESYEKDVTTLSQVGQACWLAFDVNDDDKDIYTDITEGGYGLTARYDPEDQDEWNGDGEGWGSGRLVANGLRKTGSTASEGGPETDGRLMSSVGPKAANTIGVPFLLPGQPAGAPEALNTRCGQANVGGLGWLVCSIAEALERGLRWFDQAIQSFIRI